jgi:glucans biosynthesis protein C
MRLPQASRFHYLDHMRGLMIAFVVLQHAVQGYAEQWGGRFWFIDLPDRNRFFDVMFMWTDSFIMQALFFLAGMFVLPSLYRRGWLSFTWEKIARLGIPMILAIIVLVPPLGYLKYEANEEPGITYFDYWFHQFLTPEGIRAAGFWFIAFLLLFTFVAGTVDKVLPFVTRFIGRITSWLASRPVIGYVIVGTMTSALIGYSDLKWGTYWWMGLSNLFDFTRDSWFSAFIGLFVARSNMLFSYILFFILGLGVSKSELFTKTDIMERASEHWKLWLGLLLGLSFAYSWYNQTYLFDGAFNDEIRYYFAKGGQLDNAWPLIWDVAPKVLIRTTLHGFLCTTQIFALIVLLYRFTTPAMPGWNSLGLCSYGIFFFHEPIVVWTQYTLLHAGLPNLLKMLVVFSIALGLAWTFTAKVLRKLPVTRRVF